MENMEFMLYGALGVVAVLLLLTLGAVIGWVGRMAWDKHTNRAVQQETDEREQRQAIATQKALEEMLGYNVDMAYGVSGVQTNWEGESTE